MESSNTDSSSKNANSDRLYKNQYFFQGGGFATPEKNIGFYVDSWQTIKS
ncbi:hypothetical protein APA_215 [Pseudanabaena sp. lw0831]|nr:hypothetical protein APA_215 [Pseudanabaena sp. lw0831]